VKQISTLYRDRPLNARETAVYWVEHIIRHHGAPHIQYQAIHLNFFQRNSLDVIGFLLIVLYISIKLVTCSFKFVFRKIFKRSSKAENSQKRKKN
jgi:glucuronosyltransferase